MRIKSKVAWVTGAPEATLYEETIPINFKVVGSRDWLNRWIAPNAVPKDRLISVSYPGDLAPIKEDFESSPIHGFDTEGGGKEEGDGLDPLSPNSLIILAQYGTPNMIYLMEPKLLLEFKPWLQSEKHLLLGQNLKYDFEFIMSKYKFPLVNMYDTMLAEQMLTAGMLGVNVGLSDLMRKYPPHYITNKSIRSQFINFKLGSKFTADMLYYGARDVFGLFPVYSGQKPELKRLNLESVAQDEFNCIPVTAEMELGGLVLDEWVIKTVSDWYGQRQKELEHEIIVEYNRLLVERGICTQVKVMPEVLDQFDVNSSYQKLQALQGLGGEYEDLEDVQRETLVELNTVLCKLLAEYTECQKITSTYGQGLLNKRSKWTGLFHPEFNQMGKGEGGGDSTTTATERYSSDAQQIPRPVKEYKQVEGQELDKVLRDYQAKLIEIGYLEVS